MLDLASALSTQFEPVILAPMTPGAEPLQRMDGVEIRRYRYAPISNWQRLASPGAIMPNLRRSPWLYALVPSFILGQLLAVVSLLRREHFDVIHCHWIIPQGFVLALASLFVRVPPTLLTSHGADAFTLDSRIFQLLKAWIIGRFEKTSVVSPEIAKKLREVVGRESRFSFPHISMGVDVEQFSAPYERTTSGPTILFAGRLAAKKGVANLIRAFADRRIRGRDSRLRIVGDGPLLNELRQLAKDLDLGDSVSFAGPVPHRQLAEEMRSASLFCAPFVIAEDGDREGTPTVILEAAAAGLPIIATDVGGCSEIIRHGESGWLLPTGDVDALAEALLDALEHPDRAERFARASRKKAKLHSWPNIAERHAVVLNELIQQEVGVCEVAA